MEWNDHEFNTWLGRMGKEKVVGARAVILFDVWKGTGWRNETYACA